MARSTVIVCESHYKNEETLLAEAFLAKWIEVIEWHEKYSAY